MEPKVTIAINAARLAAKEIHKFSRRRDKINVFEKGPTDFVTQVDSIAENIIIDTLKTSFPHQGNKNAVYHWVIDPLDGTTNFIHNFPFYSISIACFYKGSIEHGLIYDLSRDDEYYASKGQGAFLNNSRIRVSEIKGLKNSLMCNSFHGGPDLEPKFDQLSLIKSLYSNSLTLRRTGSTALDLAFVASGKLDAFLGYGMKLWDFAAGALLVMEAGGFITNFNGDEDVFSSHHIVAGNMACVKAINEEIKNSLA
jgi:myo-inositol-1(or 4)-monophosphatase